MIAFNSRMDPVSGPVAGAVDGLATQAVAFGGNDTRGPIEVATAVNAHGGPHGRLDFESETFVAQPLRSNPYNNSDPGMEASMHVMSLGVVRRLTPRECERLQGYQDDYTLVPYRGKPAADGNRYKALGNSMAVPCVSWIGRRIRMVEGIG